MRTIFCFVAISLNTHDKGVYSYRVYEDPDFEREPLISFTGKIKKDFVSGPNMGEFYALSAALYRVSTQIKRNLNGLPFRLVLVCRNKNAVRWINSPARYVDSHKNKGIRVSNAFNFSLDASLDPVCRANALCSAEHPDKKGNNGRVSNKLLDIKPEVWQKWTPSHCERALREVKKEAELRFGRLQYYRI